MAYKENPTFEALETKAFEFGKSLQKPRIPTIPTYSELMSVIKPPPTPTVDLGISKKITPSQEAETKQGVQRFGDVPKLDFYDKWKEIGAQPSQLVPFISSGAEAIRLSKLLMAANRLDKNTETDDDLRMLKDYVDTANTDTTFGYKVWDVISGMPSFVGEIYATGGIATAVRVGAKKTLKKLLTKKGKNILEKKIAQKGVGLTAEIIARTAQAPVAGITRIPASTIEKQLHGKLKEIATEEKKEDLGKSIIKAFGEQWVEVLSEFSGGLFTSLSKPIKNRFLKVALFASFQKANPGASPTALAKVVKRMGWNGVISEMFEERMADVGHGILHSIGAGDQKFKLPSAEQLAVEFVAFSVPGVAISALNRYDSDLKSVKGITPGLTIKAVKDIDELKAKEKELKETIKITKGLAINEKIELIQVREKIEEVSKAKEVPEVPKLVEAIKEVEPISVELEPLTKEAKKYKSAEEFIASQGKPVYHGTKSVFDKFDDTKLSSNTEWLNAKWGHYFTEDKNIAKRFLNEDAKMIDDTRAGKIIEARIDLKKPLDFTSKGITTKKEQAQIIYEAMTGKEVSSSKALDSVKDAYDEASGLGNLSDFYDDLYKNLKIKDIAQEKGYDGLISHYGELKGKDIKEYAVFSADQIKTKSQLTDIWNKTTKAVKEVEPLENDIISHIKKNGGIIVDFNGNILKDGYAFSILDKTDEVALTIDEKFDIMFIKIFNNFKNKYKDKKDVYFGGWVEGNKFIFDIVYQSKSLKKSLYEGILKRQTAIGDLAKYNTGEDGTINISKEIIDSIEPLSERSFKESETIFKNWDEVKSYYSEKNYINTPEINSEVILKMKPAKLDAGFVVPEKLEKVIKDKKAIDALKIVEDIKEERAKEKLIKPPLKTVKQTLEKLGIKKPVEKITKAEDILLKSQLRAQARSARKVAAKTRKETRKGILKDIKEKKETVENIKKAIYDYAKELPASLRGKLLGKMKNVNTYKGLEKEVAPLVEKLKEGYSRKVIIKEINKIYEKIKKKKQAGRVIDRRYDPDVQNILNKFREASKLSKSEAQELINENLEKYSIIEKDKMMPADKAMDNRILSMASGMKNMSLIELIALRDVISNMEETGAITGALSKFNREAKEKAQVEKATDIILPEEGFIKGVEVTGVKHKYEDMIGFFKLLPLLKIKEGRAKIRGASFQKLMMLFNNMIGWKDVMDTLSFNDKSSLPWNSWLSKHFNITPSESNYKEGLAIKNQEIAKMHKEAYGYETDRAMKKKMSEDTERFSLGIFETEIEGKKESIELAFSKSEARYMWMVQQDPSLKEAFTEGMYYTEEMFKAIDNSLSKADKVFCKEQLKWYKGYYKRINEVYRELNGVDLPFNEFYIRIRRGDMAKDIFSSFDNELAFRRSIHKGSLKLRVPNTQLIKTSSDIVTMQTHIAEMEHYIAFGLKNRDINVIFGNAKVRSAIIQEYGKSFLKLVDNFRDAIANTGKENAYLLDGWEKVRARFVTGVLAGRPTIAMKQLVSMIAYADSIPAVEFAKGEFDFWKNPIERYKFLQKHSKFFQYRGENIERDLRIASQSDAYVAFRNKSNYINALMLNVRLGDKSAILVGGWAIYKYHYNQAIKAGKSETEAIKKGIEEFENISSATQQSSAVADQSVWQRGNPIMRLLTTFMSSPNLYFRKMIGAIRNLIAERGTKKQHAKTFAIYWFLIPMLFQLISDFGRWDEKEQKRAMILGPLNGMFIVGDGLDFILREVMRFDIFNKPGEEKISRFGQNEIYQTLFSDIVNVMKSSEELIFDDITTENVMQAIKDLSTVTSKATGYPVKYGYDIFRGVADTASGDYVKGIGEMAGWSEYIIKEKVKDVEKKKRKKKRKVEVGEFDISDIDIDDIDLDSIDLADIDIDTLDLSDIDIDDIDLDSIDLSDIDISSL